MTIGLDLGDRKSCVCVLDGDGTVVAESRIALETGGHSAWVSELLKELGHEVLVVNARKLRMIFQRDSKNG